MKMYISKSIYCIFFFVLLIPLVSISQGIWKKLNIPTTRNLQSVCFVDSLYGWAGGDSGTILHTNDGGKHWTIQETNSINEIVEVFFLNRNQGWASSLNYINPPYGTILLKTTDGGQHWIKVPYPEENIFITCILFLDSQNGWMGGRPHALLKTTNGGIDWYQAGVDTSILAFFPVLNIAFYNSQYGYACGGMFDIAGVVWFTSNGGDTWKAIDPANAPADEVRQLYLFDSTHLIGAGGDPDYGYGVGMIRTSDGGNSWSYQELGMQGIAYDIDFRNEREAWSPLGPKEKLIYSMDSGSTWTEINTPDSTSIFEMTFPDSLHGFGVGTNGAMIAYHPQSTGGLDPYTLQSTETLVQHQNIPNPFSNHTTLRFDLPRPGTIGIRVCDLLGNEMVNITRKFALSGEQQIILQTSAWPEGIYCCRVGYASPWDQGYQVTTKKMILQR